MIGALLHARSCRATSIPSPSGRPRSSSTISGLYDRAIVSASAPVVASGESPSRRATSGGTSASARRPRRRESPRGHAAPSGGTRGGGRWIRKRAPPCARVSPRMRPPCASTIPRANRQPEPRTAGARPGTAHKILEDVDAFGKPGSIVAHRDLNPARAALCGGISTAAFVGVYLLTLSRRFTSICSNSAASTCSSGSSAGIRVEMPRGSKRGRTRPSAPSPTSSSSGTHSRCSTSAPDSTRVMSRRLSTNRSR